MIVDGTGSLISSLSNEIDWLIGV